jgi:hypothetical protein
MFLIHGGRLSSGMSHLPGRIERELAFGRVGRFSGPRLPVVFVLKRTVPARECVKRDKFKSYRRHRGAGAENLVGGL